MSQDSYRPSPSQSTPPPPPPIPSQPDYEADNERASAPNCSISTYWEDVVKLLCHQTRLSDLANVTISLIPFAISVLHNRQMRLDLQDNNNSRRSIEGLGLVMFIWLGICKHYKTNDWKVNYYPVRYGQAGSEQRPYVTEACGFLFHNAFEILFSQQHWNWISKMKLRNTVNYWQKRLHRRDRDGRWRVTPEWTAIREDIDVSRARDLSEEVDLSKVRNETARIYYFVSTEYLGRLLRKVFHKTLQYNVDHQMEIPTGRFADNGPRRENVLRCWIAMMADVPIELVQALILGHFPKLIALRVTESARYVLANITHARTAGQQKPSIYVNYIADSTGTCPSIGQWSAVAEGLRLYMNSGSTGEIKRESDYLARQINQYKPSLGWSNQFSVAGYRE